MVFLDKIITSVNLDSDIIRRIIQEARCRNSFLSFDEKLSKLHTR